MSVLYGQPPGKNTSSDSEINIPTIRGDQFVPGQFSNYPNIKDMSLYDFGVQKGPPGPQPTPAKHSDKADSIGYQKGKIPIQKLNDHLAQANNNKSGSIPTAPQGFANLKSKIMNVPNTYNMKGMSGLNSQTMNIQSLISSIGQFAGGGGGGGSGGSGSSSSSGGTSSNPGMGISNTANTANTANTSNSSSNTIFFLPGQIGV